MIIEVAPEALNTPLLEDCVRHYDAFLIEEPNRLLVVTGSGVKELEPRFAELARQTFVFGSDIQLASLDFMPKRRISVNDTIFGGDTNKTILIAGPCSVESHEQVAIAAEAIKSDGGRFFRAGAYKPRTSPYSFQGLGRQGLEILRETCDDHGLSLVSEVRDSTHVDDVLELVDVVQVGAKAMYDHGILKACGRSDKPILLKRGFGTTLQEFVQAAEFILSLGNDQVMLCERGIRTFETKTRFTLDLCGVAYLKHHVNLPVVVDPSHALGYRYGIADLTRAAFAMGVDGLLIEAHPDPSVAKSDASQQITLDDLSDLRRSLKRLEAGVDQVLI